MNYSEADWKLFKSKLPTWQEAYMDKLVAEYIDLLNGPEKSSEKLYELEEQIKENRNNPGISIDMRRSMLTENLISLIIYDVITLSDLDDFSKDLKDAIGLIFPLRYNDG